MTTLMWASKLSLKVNASHLETISFKTPDKLKNKYSGKHPSKVLSLENERKAPLFLHPLKEYSSDGSQIPCWKVIA